MNEFYRNYLEQHRKERNNITLRSKSLIKPSNDKVKDFVLTNKISKQTIYSNNNDKVLLNTKTLYSSATKQNKWKSNLFNKGNLFKSTETFGKKFIQSPSIPFINTNKISFNQIDWSLLLKPDSERVIKTKGQNQLIYEKLTVKKEKELFNTKTKFYKENPYHEMFDRNRDNDNNTITNLFSTNYNKFNRKTIKLEDYLRKTEFKCSSSRVDCTESVSDAYTKATSKESNIEITKEDEDNKDDISINEDDIKINKDIINKENEVPQNNNNVNNTRTIDYSKLNNEIKQNEQEQDNPQNDDKKKEERKSSNTNIDNIFKRLLEKTQKEAEARNNNTFLNSTQFQQKIYNKKATSTKFFNATNSNFTKANENLTPVFNLKGNIEFTLDKNEIYHWYKHEEIWNNLTYLNNIDNIKFLSPPNERDILLFYYYHKFNCKDNRIMISSDSSPEEEIKKWKTVYKKLMIRWHPDKLFYILEKLPIEEELINKIKKKTCSIINHLGSLFNSIIDKVKSMK